MFGTYRTLLAVMVVLLHLGGVPKLGSYAVFGFYILSGYLMTLIMQESYGYSPAGLARYALNRFLRIYPLYWVSCLLSLLCIYALGPHRVSDYAPSIYPPITLEAILKNLLILFSLEDEPRLTPPAWALTVELFFYVCIGCGASRNKSITIGWFLLSVLYTIAANVLELGWSYKYSLIPAASLPFATGALIYHYGDFVVASTGNLFKGFYAPLILFFLIIVNWALGYALDTLEGISFYSNYLLCALISISLAKRQGVLWIANDWDHWLGDLSYPIYLIHYQVGLLVVVLGQEVGLVLERPELSLAVVALPFICLIAWAMAKFIENPIETIRRRIKATTASQRLPSR